MDTSCHDPPPVVVTSWVAMAFPTSRSMRTVAPSTGPAGPLTVPPMVASPGPTPSIVVTVVVGLSVVEVVVARTVVGVVVGGRVVSAGAVVGAAVSPPEPLHAPARTASRTPRTRTRRGTVRAPGGGPRPDRATTRRPIRRPRPPAPRRPAGR